MHDEAGYFRIQLAYSADGIKWQPPVARAVARRRRREGAFDRGMVLGPADPILGEREMWFPYGGFPIRHDSTATRTGSPPIGLATTRLDGFAAWRAGADEARAS